MIYPEPRILPAGDRYVLVELGNELTLDLSFMAQGLAAAIAKDGLKGIVETAPCYASLLVHYDPERIGHASLVRELTRLAASLGPLDDIELDSRLIYVEALYLDPWSKACIDDYRAKIAPKEDDPAYVARLNGLEDEQQLVRVHAGTEYWVAAIGFWPGFPFLMALDPRCVISTPKYNPPRTTTPMGAIGMGGISSTIYAVETPGGYQLFGRTPVPIWDPARRFADAFAGSIVLLRPGDRIKFVTVERERYDAVERLVAEGRYVHNIVGYQRFSVRAYKAWVGTLDRSQRF